MEGVRNDESERKEMMGKEEGRGGSKGRERKRKQRKGNSRMEKGVTFLDPLMRFNDQR